MPLLRAMAAAVIMAALAGCSGAAAPGTANTAGAPAEGHPIRGGFAPARDYDPKIDVPVEKYADDPRKYTRTWDAETHGGTGVYEPWRDPMWNPRDEFGVYW